VADAVSPADAVGPLVAGADESLGLLLPHALTTSAAANSPTRRGFLRTNVPQ
jgi:hypothetical protein